MKKTQSFCIVIPAHNEEESIGNVLAAIRMRYPATPVIVVDDGSTDETANVAHVYTKNILRSPACRGRDHALSWGIREAVSRKWTPIVMMDADGQHDPADIAALFSVGPGDMVIGSRYGGGYKGSIQRVMGSKLFTSLLRLLGIQSADPTSGFRLLGERLSKYLAHRYPDRFGELALILLCAERGYTMCDVAVSMRPRRFGKSYMTFVQSVSHVCLGVSMIVGFTVRRIVSGRGQ